MFVLLSGVAVSGSVRETGRVLAGSGQTVYE